MSTNINTEIGTPHLYDDASYIDKDQCKPIENEPTLQPTITKASHIRATPAFDMVKQYYANKKPLQEDTYHDTTQYLLCQRGETPPFERTVSNL